MGAVSGDRRRKCRAYPYVYNPLSRDTLVIALAKAQTIASMDDDWLTARQALELAASGSAMTRQAKLMICRRANAGLIRARARLYKTDKREFENYDVPQFFWWAKGEHALKQDWQAGDFETWLRGKIRLQAYGVEFNKSDILDAVGPSASQQSEASPAEANWKGRWPYGWWEDLLIEIGRQLYVGDLQPKKQADIEKAMRGWIDANDKTAAPSTIRQRAHKVWYAIKLEAGN